MTQPRRPRSLRRSNADYRWTRPKILAFLHGLGDTGSVAAAARRVGMSRQSAYRLRARLGEQFAGLWDEGLRLAAVRRRLEATGPQGDGFSPQGDTGGARRHFFP